MEHPPLEQISFITGAYDLRHTPENHGIHGMELHFIVKGPEGAVSACFFTTWHTASARKWLEHFLDLDKCKPTPTELTIHSRTPLHEGDEAEHSHCVWTEGPCYTSTTYTELTNWLEGFLNGGTEWLWLKLTEHYNHTFHQAPAPDLTPTIRTEA